MISPNPDYIDLAAFVLSLRMLTQSFLNAAPGVDPLPEVSKSFDLKIELAAIRAALTQVMAGAPDDKLVWLRNEAITRDVAAPSLKQLANRTGREEARFYGAILIARNAAPNPLNPPKIESPEVQARALQMVIAAALTGVSDDQIIEANRSTYRQYMAIDSADPRPEMQLMLKSMEHYMDFLQRFMDTTGVTERFMATISANQN